MDNQPVMVIYRCLNGPRRQGWDRSQLSLRIGPDVMAYMRREMARVLKEHPSFPVTRDKIWGCAFDVDPSLAPNQVVVVSPTGEVLGISSIAL